MHVDAQIRFEKWLLDAGYQPSTVRGTVRDVTGVLRDCGERLGDHEVGDLMPTLSAGARASMARFMGYWVATEQPEDYVYTAMVRAGIRPVVVKLRDRQTRVAKRSFDDDEWRRLAGALNASSKPEATVLYLMACTALRIGDVLPVTLDAIEQGVTQDHRSVVLRRKGGDVVSVPVHGAYQEWNQLY